MDMLAKAYRHGCRIQRYSLPIHLGEGVQHHVGNAPVSRFGIEGVGRMRPSLRASITFGGVSQGTAVGEDQCDERRFQGARHRASDSNPGTATVSAGHVTNLECASTAGRRCRGRMGPTSG